MSLLAALGLNPAVLMQRETATKRPVAAKVATPAQRGTGLRDSGIVPASSQGQWTGEAAATPMKVIETPYGPYTYDWLDERQQQMHLVEGTLELVSAARKAHRDLANAKVRLLKAKKLVEAGPHSPEEISADVTRHASANASRAADSANDAVEHLADLTTLLIAAADQLDISHKQWANAVTLARVADDRHEANELTDAVKQEGEETDEAWKATKSVIEAIKSASDGDSFAIVMQIADLAVDLHKKYAGAGRLARAEELMALARTSEKGALVEAIRIGASQRSAFSEAIERLNERAEKARQSVEHSRTKVAFAFDADSKGPFKLRSLAMALKVSDEVRLVAINAGFEASSARRGGGTLARAAVLGQAHAAENGQLIDRLLREARLWEQAAHDVAERCHRQSVHWRSLYDAAIKAMSQAAGQGQSIDDALTMR